MTIAGLVTGEDVCDAAQAVLDARLPDVLAALATADVPLPMPTSYELPAPDAMRNFDGLALIVSSPGAGEPVVSADGSVSLVWTVVVTILARGDNYAQTSALVKRYTAAVWHVLEHQQDLNGLATEVRPQREAYDEVDAAKARTLGAGFVEALVLVDNARRRTGGVAAPEGPEVPVSTVSFDLTRLDNLR